jgi:putative PIN family toxin of toxin-antitoxin system
MSEIRLVLDTNVIVSALLSKSGYPSIIWNKALAGEYRVYYSLQIIEEYTDVLSRRKIGIDEDEKNDVLNFMLRHGIEVFPAPSEKPDFVDEDDRVFYDTTKTADAILVTGNGKHYPSESWIASPARFMQSNP